MEAEAEALVLDTGPILALLNADDDHHDRCVDLVRDLGESLVVPAPTLVEVDDWVRTRLDVAVWRTFVEDLAAGAYRLEPVAEADVVRAAELEERYTDLGLGFVDAAVIAAVIPALRAASIDPAQALRGE